MFFRRPRQISFFNSKRLYPLTDRPKQFAFLTDTELSIRKLFRNKTNDEHFFPTKT